MATRFTIPDRTAFSSNGLPSPGAKAYFYVTGTSTPADVYTTSALTTAHANPVVADSAGRLPAIYLDPAVTYKVTLTDKDGTTLGSVIDPYLGTKSDFFVSVEAFGAVGDGSTDDSSAIQAAIDAVGAAGGGKVLLDARTYAIETGLLVGDGSSGTASTYNNVELVGMGAAPLDSTASATELKWTGTTSSSNVMVTVSGRCSGMGVSGIYLNANDKAGDCLVVKSCVHGNYDNLLGQNYLRYGCHLTIQGSPASASWYITRNMFSRCYFAETTNENTQAWRFEGAVGAYSNGIWGNTFINCTGLSFRSLTAAHRPTGMYLGYCDSNTFIECSFSLASITADAILNDIDALKAANGASYTDEDIIKLRYFGNTVADAKPDNIRYEVYYYYDAGSSATGDDDNVVEPADSNGRFLKYQGAGVMLDSTTKDKFPQNIAFENCDIIEGPSFQNITTNGNGPGNTATKTPSIILKRMTMADAEEIPIYIANAVGETDAGLRFGKIEEALHRGDSTQLGLEQDNACRKVYFQLNALSSTGGGAADHSGAYLAFAERANDQASYSISARINFGRTGHMWPETTNAQDLGTSSKAWLRTYTQRLIFNERTTAPTAEEGLLIVADGSGWDPLGLAADGRAHPVIYLNGTYQTLLPGYYPYRFVIADDAATSFTPPGDNGFFKAFYAGTSTRYASGFYLAGGSPAMTSFHEGSGASVTTGALAGTTGVDGELTLSTHTDGKIYVENRTGAQKTITVLIETTIQ